jgi:hypothetical protein
MTFFTSPANVITARFCFDVYRFDSENYIVALLLLLLLLLLLGYVIIQRVVSTVLLTGLITTETTCRRSFVVNKT